MGRPKGSKNNKEEHKEKLRLYLEKQKKQCKKS